MKIFVVLAVLFSFDVMAAQVVSLRNYQGQVTKLSQLTSMRLGTQSLSMKTISTDKAENLTKYQIAYKNIPVWGYQAVIRINKNNVIDRLHGYTVQGIEKDVLSTKPDISEDAALTIARNYHEKLHPTIKGWGYENLKNGLYIFIDDQQKAHLAYVVSFFTDSIKGGTPARPFISVDAHSGKVISYNNELAFDTVEATGPGGNVKTGKWYYGKDRPALQVTKDASGNCMMDTGDVMTVDMQNQGSEWGDPESVDVNTPFTFPCGENTQRPINDAYSPLNDAHANGVATFNMYKEWFGISPLNIKLKLRVHFAVKYENAFWDGKSMTFGDGDTLLYPTSTGTDVTGHEVSHGFTEQHSNLEYRAESGGINEAFSDMAGEALEYFLTGHNDFKLGAEIMKSQDALRYMDDPTKDGSSIDNVANFKWASYCDSGWGGPDCTDVHYSSGIFNKAFYLIATAPGSDTKKAFSLFERANANYWTAKTGFADGAKGVLDAANDLKFPADVVKSAFATVGINL